ncbi:hypothetical protein K378_01368 [Streptomyces sp. Amel2xB2]|uniref:hypothetical protein n=1 Tax=Streptomyces sp. Amel2xB2 TaxID=1305829 RepID=UPI000DB946B1|nr:hypothetical protein [Streptomyces sp. Amel2xB2]RAJ70203.1 hypothetical protein K378_01368 [Streptomyces sp. Amel2xB2]
MTVAIPANPKAAEAERVIRTLVEDYPEDLAELLDAAASANFQTSHGNDDAHSVHERDALVQQLAEAVSRS